QGVASCCTIRGRSRLPARPTKAEPVMAIILNMGLEDERASGMARALASSRTVTPTDDFGMTLPVPAPEAEGEAPMRLWTVGYGSWPASTRAGRLVEALRRHGVTRLVDARISPCASNLVPGHHYGPKPWNLQVGPEGIAALMAQAGIAYEWLVE